jgi:hypothetical protein
MKKGKGSAGVDADSGRRLNIRSCSEIETKPVEWLWPGRIVFAGLTIFNDQTSKGTLRSMLAEIAANFTGKLSWPVDGLEFRSASGVLYAGQEPREFGKALSWAGANMHEVRSTGEGNGDPYRAMLAALDEFPSCGMVVIDSRLNRPVAAALCTVARDRGVAVVAPGPADEIAGLATTVLDVSVTNDPIHAAPRGVLRVVRNKHGEPAAPLDFWIQEDAVWKLSRIEWRRR